VAHHGETTASYVPSPRLDDALDRVPLVEVESRRPRRIGYLTNYSFHIWYQIVMEVMRRRAAQYGAAVDVHDAELSIERQIDGARTLLPRVDALVLTPAADAGLESVLDLARQKGTPVVVEANPVSGMRTLVAICDYDAGVALGRWVGTHVQPRHGGLLRVLDVGLPTLRPCLLRSEGFLDGLRGVCGSVDVVGRVNGHGSAGVAHREALRAFDQTRAIDVIFAMDDETGQGARQAWLDTGGREDDITVASFGLAGDQDKERLMRRGALKVCAAMFPEYVAVKCVDAVMRLAADTPVPLRDVTPTLPVTADDLSTYYRRHDGAWTPDFGAIRSIPVVSTCGLV
jgi:ribose transport system substrate-binding protein